MHILMCLTWIVLAHKVRCMFSQMIEESVDLREYAFLLKFLWIIFQSLGSLNGPDYMVHILNR